jgi:phage gp16-like protein
MNQNQRRATLAAIHVIKKSLGMDDDSYRDVLAGKFAGRRSCTELSQTELNQWLIHLKRLQTKSGLNTQGVRHAAMLGKCEALWIELRKAGAVQDGSPQALQAFVQNQTGAAGLRMANGQQLFNTIEILKKWLARANANTAKSDHKEAT